MKNVKKFNMTKVPFWGVIAGVGGIAVAITGIILLKKKHDVLEESLNKIKNKLKKS